MRRKALLSSTIIQCQEEKKVRQLRDGLTLLLMSWANGLLGIDFLFVYHQSISIEPYQRAYIACACRLVVFLLIQYSLVYAVSVSCQTLAHWEKNNVINTSSIVEMGWQMLQIAETTDSRNIAK
jgi:hypothetical protein